MRYRYEEIVKRVNVYLADDDEDSPRLRSWKELVVHITAQSFLYRNRLPADEAVARVWEEFEVAARGHRRLLFLGFWHHLAASMHSTDLKPFIVMLDVAFKAARADNPVLHYNKAVFDLPILSIGKPGPTGDPGQTDKEAMQTVDWELVDQLLSGTASTGPTLPSAVKPKPTKVPHLQIIIGGRGFT